MDVPLFIFQKIKENPWGFLSAIIGFFTLILAYRISRQFSRNNLKVKQVEHVCNLIKHLVSSQITISFASIDNTGGTSSSGSILKFNIFEIANYNKGDRFSREETFEENVVFFDQNSNQLIDIKEWIDNPLTPPKIADQLLLFYNSNYKNITRIDDEYKGMEFVQVASGIKEDILCYNMEGYDAGGPIEVNGFAYETWLNLKQSCSRLKYEIKIWLIDNGIQEINMREDFKYTLSFEKS